MPTVTQAIRRFLASQRKWHPGADLIDRYLQWGAAMKHNPVPQLTQEEIISFWSKVDQTGDPTTCWEWQGATNGRKGYGQLTIRQRHLYAHRLAYALTHRDPGELLVCHHCDNRLCCNPSHHFLGTMKDDVQDMVVKGRARDGARQPLKGSSHPQAKLTEFTIRQIRASKGISCNDWARRLDVSPGTISCVLTKRTWKHLLEDTHANRN